LYVDKDVSFADLKQTLYYFVTEMFGADTKVRFRPSYFPFTEQALRWIFPAPYVVAAVQSLQAYRLGRNIGLRHGTPQHAPQFQH